MDWSQLIHGSGLARIVWVVSSLVLALQVAQNAVYLTNLFRALPVFFHARTRSARLREWWLLTSEVTPAVSMLIPGYNEEASIVETVRSMLALNYPQYEIVVINDGSTDNTLATLIEAFQLQPVSRAVPRRIRYKLVRGVYAHPSLPNLIVVDKENGGKSDALNAAIDLAHSPYVCTMDADSLLDSDSLLKAIRPFVDAPEKTTAVGGTIRVVSDCFIRGGRVVDAEAPRPWLELFQSVEYLRSFLMARMAWTSDRTVTIISGAFGIFRRDVLLELGGYAHDIVGEDMELVIRLHRRAGDAGGQLAEVWHVPDPVCWTEAPSSLKVMARQRTRWQRGLCETLWRHRQMLGRTRYRAIGCVIMPAFVLFDVIGPFLELLGMVLVPASAFAGILSMDFFIAYCAVVFGFGLCISLSALTLAEYSLTHHRRVQDLVWLGVAAIVENFGYRQLNCCWRVQGMWQFLSGKKGWGTMARRGFIRKD